MTVTELAPRTEAMPTPLDLRNKSTQRMLEAAATRLLEASVETTDDSTLAYTTESDDTTAYEDKLRASLARMNPEEDDDLLESLTAKERKRLEREQRQDAGEAEYDRQVAEKEAALVAFDARDEDPTEVARSAYRADVIQSGEAFNASAAGRRLSHLAVARAAELDGDYYDDDDDYEEKRSRIDTGNVRGTLRSDMGLRVKLKEGEYDDSITVTKRNPADTE